MFTFDHLIIQKIVNIIYVVVKCLIIVSEIYLKQDSSWDRWTTN
jgi:hypothetical protein